jgi:hypothetical protein
MHQQSLGHSYSKRETSLTKLKNSQKCDDFSGEISHLTDTLCECLIFLCLPFSSYGDRLDREVKPVVDHFG